MTDSLICCLPTYACRPFLRRALRGIVEQTFAATDVYVVDDGSDDLDVGLMAEFPTVTFLRMAVRRGPYAAVNCVIHITASEYVAFHDADDWSSPHRFARQIERLKYGDADGCGTAWCTHEFTTGDRATVHPPEDATTALRAERRPALLHPTTTYRRRALERVGPFDPFTLFGGDTEFHLRAALLLRLVNIQDALYERQIRRGSLTAHHATGKGSQARNAYSQRMRHHFRKLQADMLNPRPSGYLLDGTHVTGTEFLWDSSSFGGESGGPDGWSLM